jgi:acetyltransferase-like isoleucine patch superfamily enzyme
MPNSLRLLFKSAVCTVLFKARGVRCSRVGCDGRLPQLYTIGKVTIGQRFGVRGRMLPCELGAALPKAHLHIGDRVFVNNGASVVAHCGIEIGNDTRIGDFVAIYDTDHHSVDSDHPVKYAPVVIGSNVWLGRNVTVLPGSKIGDHTVVAAGSVVKGDLPPRVLAAGNPAKPVKELVIADGWRRL